MSSSFQLLRRLLADQIEPRSWGNASTTSAGTTTTLISTQLMLTGGDGDALDAGWVYWPAGTLIGQQRPIRRGGLDIATGTITVGTAFTASTPDASEFEIHLRYPITRSAGSRLIPGYREAINDAIRRLWFRDDLAVSAVTGQVRYLLDTATYPWLADEPGRRVLDVMAPLESDSVKRPSSCRWRIDDEAEAPALIFESGGYNTGQTFYLRVARPANTRIKISSTWTDVTAASLNAGVFGLAADTDETHALPDHVLALAITESMNHLAMAQPSLEASIWEARRNYWASIAAACKFARLPRRRDGRRRLVAVGLGGGAMGGWG